MRRLSLVAPAVRSLAFGALAFGALAAGGCGAGASAVRAASSVSGASQSPGGLAFHPDASETYVFRREMIRTRRTERNVTTIEGELRASAAEAGGWQLALSVGRARYTQSEQPIQDFPAEPGAPPIALVESVDARGARLAPSLGDDVRFALGSEIVQAILLVPIGTAGLALPPSAGATTAVLGLPEDAVIPRELPVRCTEADVEGMSAWAALRCEAPLDRELEASAEARAQGIRAFVRGTMVIEASIERASGLARRSEVRLAFDVVSTLGAYEEHDAVELVLRTEVDPRVR